jgi:pimeloyl-ACP methyl ester carboxylesterase
MSGGSVRSAGHRLSDDLVLLLLIFAIHSYCVTILPMDMAYFVPVEGTQLHVVERGQGYPMIILHGGPGLDHHMFAGYLDPLGSVCRLLFVDQRSQGLSPTSPRETWTLEQMARDVADLAEALSLDRYHVLGHSFGAMVALQHAVDFPSAAAGTVLSAVIPSARFLSHVEHSLATFGTSEMREQLVISWARERVVRTPGDVASLLSDQLPFHFADPFDSRIGEYETRMAEARYSPEVLHHFARAEHGGIDVEHRLLTVSQPVLVLTGRHDRTCSVEAARSVAQGVQHGRLVVLENSGHMMFVEENEQYLAAIRTFLRETT